jgi:hypothetical protein
VRRGRVAWWPQRKRLDDWLNTIAVLLGLIVIVGGGLCHADPLFPDIPKRNLPTVRQLPKQGEIILDVQSTVLSGDPITSTGSTAEGFIDSVGVQVGIFDLARQTESIWDLPHDIPLIVPISCNSCTMRASWASKQRRLLLAMKDDAYLVDETGHFDKINLKMPGVAIRYADADDFAISDDGSLVAFKLTTRDSGDKFADTNDPYTIKLGRYYSDVFYEDIRGSAPITVARTEIRFDANGKASGKEMSVPAWSPDHKKVAYRVVRYDKNGALAIEISEIRENGIVSIAAVNLPATSSNTGVEEIRWSPDGKKLGFIVFSISFDHSVQRVKHTLFTVTNDGGDLTTVRVGTKDINVSAFAWSPEGDRIALRSDFEAKAICNHNLPFYLQAGVWPCRTSEHLFTSNADGTGLKRVSKEPAFRNGELFWIQ